MTADRIIELLRPGGVEAQSPEYAAVYGLVVGALKDPQLAGSNPYKHALAVLAEVVEHARQMDSTLREEWGRTAHSTNNNKKKEGAYAPTK